LLFREHSPQARKSPPPLNRRPLSALEAPSPCSFKGHTIQASPTRSAVLHRALPPFCPPRTARPGLGHGGGWAGGPEKTDGNGRAARVPVIAPLVPEDPLSDADRAKQPASPGVSQNPVTMRHQPGALRGKTRRGPRMHHFNEKSPSAKHSGHSYKFHGVRARAPEGGRSRSPQPTATGAPQHLRKLLAEPAVSPWPRNCPTTISPPRPATPRPGARRSPPPRKAPELL